MKKIIIGLALILLTSGCIVDKSGIRAKCHQDNMDYSITIACEKYACQTFNLTYGTGGNWFDGTVDCMNEDGAQIRVDWKSVDYEPCREAYENWFNMITCILEKDADF